MVRGERPRAQRPLLWLYEQVDRDTSLVHNRSFIHHYHNSHGNGDLLLGTLLSWLLRTSVLSSSFWTCLYAGFRLKICHHLPGAALWFPGLGSGSLMGWLTPPLVAPGSNSCFALYMGSGPAYRCEPRARIRRATGPHTAEAAPPPHRLALELPPPPFTAEETEARAAS